MARKSTDLFIQVNTLVPPGDEDKVKAYAAKLRGDHMLKEFERLLPTGEDAFEDPLFDYMSDRMRVKGVPVLSAIYMLQDAAIKNGRANELEDLVKLCEAYHQVRANLERQEHRMKKAKDEGDYAAQAELNAQLYVARAEVYARGMQLVGHYGMFKVELEADYES